MLNQTHFAPLRHKIWSRKWSAGNLLLRARRVGRATCHVVLATLAFGLLLGSFPAWAAGGDSAPPIVIVADTRYLTGIMLFWANLYNDSRILFTALTLFLIPTIGVSFGIVADVIMNRIGIDLHSSTTSGH